MGGGNITPRFYIEQNVLGRPPYNIFFQADNAIRQKMAERMIKEAEGMSFGAKRTAEEKRKEIYVLYIGESVRYENLTVSGYHRDTTPLLASLDNLVLYTDYYTTANLTMYSVPQIVTRATPDDYNLSYKERSIVKPFKECGFKVFVIGSNIMATTPHLTAGCDGIIRLPATEDARMGSMVDSLASHHDKLFVILHPQGNHGPYINFGKEQDVYHPNPVSDKVSWDNHEAMVNAYDNTMRLTDKVVYDVIKAIDRPATLAALMFLSDHGADYDTGVSDHGGNCNPRKAEYHVPFFVWMNDVWCGSNGRKLSNLKRHRTSPVNADNVFYSLCDMAGISLSAQYRKPQWSVFGDSLASHRRLLLVPDGKNYIVVE